MALPTDAKARKAVPICTGVIDYFPDALAAVAEVSRLGNEQHNPGQPLHWAKGKSTDHADCIARHLVERGTADVDGGRHSAKLAWRALALLQTEIETERAKKDRLINIDGETRREDQTPVEVPKRVPGLLSHIALKQDPRGLFDERGNR